ncbi:MAG: preprotein translocase subunit SecA, partial [Crocinitomicaceae bacterium]|nr:preprotein translocase subunit SecA [Crocinitomicaceae bacterium]
MSILKKLFGDKSSKDRKAYQPAIDQANEMFAKLQSLSDDELRGKTAEFKRIISEGTSDLEVELETLKAKAADLATPIQDKEGIFEKIDALTKEIDEKIEDLLDQIRPDAFAVVKETAKRWAENGKLEVTATDFDKDLAGSKDGITIDGEKAIWHNS